jgi:hypothetical protein
LRPVRLIVLLLAMAASACAPPRPPAGPAAASGAAADTAWVSDVLYFGRSIPGGGSVADAEWEAFLREVVTPLFPDGLTVWEAHGQWRGVDGQVAREDSRVVQVVHRPSGVADSALARIAAEYRRRFRQESVLRVRSRVEVAF